MDHSHFSYNIYATMEGQNFQIKVGKSKFKFGHGWLDLWKWPKNIKGKNNLKDISQ